MKTLLICASLTLSTCATASCLPVEYQELKEYATAELLSKFCKDEKSLKVSQASSDINKTFAEMSKALGDVKGQTEALTKWGTAAEEVNVCKNEMERVARILKQRDIDEQTVRNQCGTPKVGGDKR